MNAKSKVLVKALINFDDFQDMKERFEKMPKKPHVPAVASESDLEGIKEEKSLEKESAARELGIDSTLPNVDEAEPGPSIHTSQDEPSQQEPKSRSYWPDIGPRKRKKAHTLLTVLGWDTKLGRDEDLDNVNYTAEEIYSLILSLFGGRTVKPILKKEKEFIHALGERNLLHLTSNLPKIQKYKKVAEWSDLDNNIKDVV